ncbi:MAG: hypothetical protein EA376_02235 [Phycisphaeraceae bacterium]|nr:MAG: hypothetical protein EA376_02235 [Phycisphaeraceae bacterium]
MAGRDDKSLLRSLGEFVGHVWKGVKTDPAKQGERRTLRHDVEEETRDGPEGRVTLRRTTIEEIEVDRSK